MSKIAVIYWSGTGNTQAMAEAVAAGAKEAGAEADLLTCADVSDISAYDAAALGCPAFCRARNRSPAASSRHNLTVLIVTKWHVAPRERCAISFFLGVDLHNST